MAKKIFRSPMGHPTSLNQDHILGPARDVNINELSLHLILNHGVSSNHIKTKSEMGRFHLLVHAMIASPELRAKLDLPDNYGTESYPIPQKH